jgi:electron transport complex protein RnfC
MDAPVGKGTNALLAFCDKEEKTVEHPVCIRCGKCVSVCPMHLEPLLMNLYASKDRLAELEELNLFDCIECGSCSYICPGRVHLVHNFRTAKQKINNKRAAERAAAEAAAKAEAK